MTGKPLTARDKYINVFGRLESLAQPIPWSTGVSNMLEWLAWSTNSILGVTKTRYREKIVAWSHDEVVRHGTLDEKIRHVSRKLDEELVRSEQSTRYAHPISAIASPREALRRAKFFSEDYLNKEFDIFWTLVSDKYLDSFYRQFTRVEGGGEWSTHGNSGLFSASTDISAMQMDNLSYNETGGLLVANELKLGGKKNPDQILKYALMFKLLRDRNFIIPETRFLLLFISGSEDSLRWDALIEEEIAFCQRSSKSTARAACQPDIVAIARSAEYASATWKQLIEFNGAYSQTLDPETQQVERKLLWGFNESLAAKNFMWQQVDGSGGGA